MKSILLSENVQFLFVLVGKQKVTIFVNLMKYYVSYFMMIKILKRPKLDNLKLNFLTSSYFI